MTDKQIEEKALKLYPDEAYRNAIEIRKAYVLGAKMARDKMNQKIALIELTRMGNGEDTN